MAEHQDKRGKTIARIKKAGLILIGLFLLYTVVGFWVVPPLLKPRLESELSKQIGREVTIGAVKLNPLALSATTTDVAVFEIDGEPFAGFAELFVNVQLSSIFKWAVTVKEVRLTAPFGVLKILPGGKLNIEDILKKMSQPKPAPDPDAGLPRAIVALLAVKDGTFTIADLMGSEPIQESFTPISFSLENLSTLKGRQGHYEFASEGSQGAQYRLNGQISVNPVRIEGSCSAAGVELTQLWSHIKDRVSFQILNGKTTTSGDFTLAIVDGRLMASLQNGRFELDKFELAEKGQKTVLVSLPSFSVQGVRADLAKREIVVERVNTADARIKSWLAPDGSFKLSSMLLADLEQLQQMKKPEEATDTEQTTTQPWKATIDRIEVTNWVMELEDRTLTRPARFTVDEIAVSVDGLSTQKDSKAAVGAAMRINGAGAVKVNGSAGMDPLAADLEVTADKIALKSFQPYVDEAVNAKVVEGTTSSNGRIIYQGKQSQPQIRYQGEFRVEGIVIQDRVQADDFIELAQFKTSGIALDLLPNKLHAAKVLIDKPHARVTIGRDGTINVVQVFVPAAEKDTEAEPNLLRRLVDFLILQFKGPMPMDVEHVALNNFSADFVDQSVSPAYTTHLEITNATVNGLSSDPLAQAVFKMQGNIDRSATIESNGQMNPMNALKHTQVDFALKAFELSPVSPYSGKFVGYKIDKGELNLKLKYLVEDDRVNGDNRIIVDQLTLGDRVDSPDAIKLPVKLGVALLKDDKGRISLQVPVEGNVKDPQFNLGQAIKSALTGTIDEVGKSPFAAISEIDGFKGEELRLVAFEPGLSELNVHETKKLDALATFLNKKTTLSLAIEGSADREMDWAALTGESEKKTAPEDDRGIEKKTEQDTTDSEKVDDAQLQRLAQMRAEQIKTYLIQQGNVAAERVQLKPVQIRPTPEGDVGQVELFLSAVEK